MSRLRGGAEARAAVPSKIGATSWSKAATVHRRVAVLARARPAAADRGSLVGEAERARGAGVDEDVQRVDARDRAPSSRRSGDDARDDEVAVAQAEAAAAATLVAAEREVGDSGVESVGRSSARRGLAAVVDRRGSSSVPSAGSPRSGSP